MSVRRDEFPMTKQTLASSRGVQGRPPRHCIALSPEGMVGAILSLVVIGAAIFQARTLAFVDIAATVPASPLFWVVFVLSYLVGPAGDWWIFRKLWIVGPEAFPPLIRKFLFNEMLIPYFGEVYFYGWARHNLRLIAARYTAVRDVAILSAIAGHAVACAFFILIIPSVGRMPIQGGIFEVGLSIVFVCATMLAVILLRKPLFSLDRAALSTIFAVHCFRVLAATTLMAVLWHLALPDRSIDLWLILAGIHLTVGRLPFVAGREVVFAGTVILALPDPALNAVMAIMTGLILAAHIAAALGFAILDLIWTGKSEDAWTHL